MPTPIRPVILLALLVLICSPIHAKTIRDATGRTLSLPDEVRHVICSGSGCLRLLTYLRAQNRIVGVDDIETRRPQFDARPYALANPQFKNMPVFGEFRGQDNPELILSLEPQPDVIFKTYGSAMGYDPVELQAKTGIPVVVVNYGNLTALRPQLYESLRTMAAVLDQEKQAEAVIDYLEATIQDLADRVRAIPEEKKPSVYLGGVAFKGPHGYQSTEPGYPPFHFIGARNPAQVPGMGARELSFTDVAKEKILEWNPDKLFLDLSTLQLGDQAGGLHELKTDPAYRTLRAVQEDELYGLLPYNWYTQNFGSILANAYFIGHLLYPERFADIDPPAKADEIYTVLVGKPVFAEMNRLFQNLVFTRIPVH